MWNIGYEKCEIYYIISNTKNVKSRISKMWNLLRNISVKSEVKIYDLTSKM